MIRRRSEGTPNGYRILRFWVREGRSVWAGAVSSCIVGTLLLKKQMLRYVALQQPGPLRLISRSIKIQLQPYAIANNRKFHVQQHVQYYEYL